MWNCPKCNAEVDDGFEVCWSCGTTIDGREDPNFVRSDADSALPESEPSAPAIATAEALMTIASPALPEHAHVLRCHLEAAGIGVFVADEPIHGFDWLLHRGPEPIHLQVREADADRAKAILAEIPLDEKTSPAQPSGKDAEQPAVAPPPAPSVWQPPNQEALNPQEFIRAMESKLSSLMDSHDTPDWKVNPAFHPEVSAFIQAHANNAAFLKKAQSMQQNRAKYFGTIRQQTMAKAAAVAAEAAAREAEAATAPETADVPMCTEVTADVPKPRLRFRVPRFLVRLAKWTAILLVLAVIGVYLAATTYRQIGERELAETIARIDETDPGWRWDDLQAKRAEVPERENAALKVLAAAQKLSKDQDQLESSSIENEVVGLASNVPLAEPLCQQLHKALEKAGPVLAEARALADLSTGRYPAPSEPGILPTFTSHLGPVSTVRSLLFFDSVVRAQAEQSAGGAVASARALLVSGRSVGDQPGILPQLGRTGARHRTCLVLERALAQRQGPDGDLEKAQDLLQNEAAQPLMLLALKGERAWAIAQFGDETFAGSILEWAKAGWVKENQALTLAFLTEAVELAKLPVEGQVAALDALESKCQTKRSEGSPEGRFAPATDALVIPLNAARAFLHSETELRCTITALAAERYRLANEKWPGSLEALVPQYLPEVPIDRYDGKPLRMRKLDDGLVIYSVGPDREDNQGTVERKSTDLKGKDIGFRLWDVEKRRK